VVVKFSAIDYTTGVNPIGYEEIALYKGVPLQFDIYRPGCLGGESEAREAPQRHECCARLISLPGVELLTQSKTDPLSWNHQ
jgi:hypothetical protein